MLVTALISDAYQRLIEQSQIGRDAGQEPVLPLLDQIQAGLSRKQRWLRKRAPVRGLYLWGDVGRGKSLLMDLLVAHVPGARRQHFHAFLLDLHAAVHAARQAGEKDAIKKAVQDAARGLRLLALDEMDVSDIADAMLIDRLFRALLAKGVTIVTTSNRPPAELYRNGLKRELFTPFIELLETSLDIHQIDGCRDWRRLVTAGMQVQFLAGDPEFDRLWQAISAGGEAPRQISVLGRGLLFERTADRSLRANFAELCIAPLGTADHHQIAQNFDVVFLDAVPRITHIDHIRRFTTLVDELYEARKALVLRTDVQLDVVFGAPGAWQRTASRLTEMAGADWAGWKK